MAQLPDTENQNGASIMDEIKVPHDIPDQSPFNDNDSLQNNIDTEDYPDLDQDHPSTGIGHRDTAPGPPSQLTMQNMQHFDHENPHKHSTIDGFMDALGASQADIPEQMIGNLLDMGFPRANVVYALQQSHQQLGMHDSAFAVQWLFDNPTFVPPDTSNINNTISGFLGPDHSNHIDYMAFKDQSPHNPTDDPVNPPNNSPRRSDGDLDIAGIVGVGIDNRKHHDAVLPQHAALYGLIQNLNNENQSKSNRGYNYNATMQSMGSMASAATFDEEKTAIHPHSSTLYESKTDDIEDEGLPHSLASRPHHQGTVSTVNSELSVISALSAHHNSKEPMEALTETLGQNAMQMMSAESVLMMSDLKMVLVVRKDLKMTSGKVAAQCCHACLGVIMDIINGQHVSPSNGNGNGNGNGNDIQYDLKRVMSIWRSNGEKKIVVQCQNEEELLAKKQQAMIHGLPHYLVCDAGHTQVKPGSTTVLAIGPHISERVDMVTSDLKLY